MLIESNSLFRKINTRTNVYQTVFENFPYIHTYTYIHIGYYLYSLRFRKSKHNIFLYLYEKV
jgi:hypothetical protein